MLKKTKREALICINTFLKLDRTVKQQGKIIYEEKLIIANRFSYDYQCSQNKSYSQIAIDDIKKYLQDIFNLLNAKIFLLPIIIGKDPNYQCRLIWIEAKRFNNQLLGYAQCIGDDYFLNEKNKQTLSGLGIQLLPNVDLSVTTLLNSLEVIKSQFLNRLDLFCYLSNEELYYINSTYPEINDILNIYNPNDDKFHKIEMILNNRTHLRKEIITKLAKLKWYDLDTIINSYLLRKLHTGTDRYLDDKNLLIYNVNYYKELQAIGRKYNDEYLYFSMYNIIEYQMILGLNEYVYLKGNIITKERRENLNEYFKKCTIQEYIKAILGSNSSIKNLVDINTIYRSIKNYLKEQTPSAEYLNFGIIKIELGGSELGKIVFNKLKVIRDTFKNISQISVYKISDETQSLLKIKNWMVMKWSNILFIELIDKKTSELYIKTNEKYCKKIEISNDSLMYAILNKLEIQDEKAKLTISQINTFLKTIHVDYNPSFEFISFGKNKQTLPSDANQEYIRPINFFSEKTKNKNKSVLNYGQIKFTNSENITSINQHEIKSRIENLENEILMIPILKKNISSLKLEILKLTNLNKELHEELGNANIEIKQKILKIFDLYLEIMINIEYRLSQEVMLISSQDLNEITGKIRRIATDPEVNMPNIKVKNLFDITRIDLCYVTSLTIPTCTALTLCLSKNTAQIISESKFSTNKIVVNILKIDLIDAINSLLKEEESELNRAKHLPNRPIQIKDAILSSQILELLRENNLYNYEIETEEIKFKQAEIQQRCTDLIKKCQMIEAGQNNESIRNLTY